jgi:hypothetical protein
MFLDAPHLVESLWMSNQPVAETSTWQHITQQTNFHALGEIWTHNLSRWVAEDLRLTPCGHWDRHCVSDRVHLLQPTYINYPASFRETLCSNWPHLLQATYVTDLFPFLDNFPIYEDSSFILKMEVVCLCEMSVFQQLCVVLKLSLLLFEKPGLKPWNLRQQAQICWCLFANYILPSWKTWIFKTKEDILKTKSNTDGMQTNRIS